MSAPRALLRKVGAGAAGASALAIGAALAAVAFVATPLPESLLDRRSSSSVILTDRTGEPLFERRFAEGRSVPVESAPPLVRAAFVAAEDRRFDERALPIDLRAIARAARDSVKAGRIVSGASTIPQQLARRLVPRQRSVTGKLQEALWSLRLCAHLDHERILVEYVNRIPLGNGTVGVESASRFYFARPASMLSPAQAALLAGMAHAPAHEDPLRHPDHAIARRATILARMRDAATGVLADDDAYARALAEPLDVDGARSALRAPHFAQGVLASLEERGLRDAVRVETTIDPALQRDVERIIDEELGGPMHGLRVGQAAAIVVDNDTGDILAYAGSRDFFDDEHGGKNDGVRAKRQPGSALKPFVYGLALAHGLTPATLIPDVDLTLATESGTYAPRNYDKREHGPVRLRAALQNSYNVPAVHVAEQLGPPAILEELRSAGFTSLDRSPEHYGVGIVLGDGDVTLYEMARGFRGLARGGVVSALSDVKRAVDGNGTELALPASFAPHRFLPRDAVALLTDIISDDPSRAPAFGLDDALKLPFPVAAKTGTSRAYVDNWTAGFTHERTVAVWAGNFDGTPMRNVSGITGAGPIFRRIMLRAMNGIDPHPLVDAAQFDTVSICPLSGDRAGHACAGAFNEHFLRGTAPTRTCATHHLVADVAVASATTSSSSASATAFSAVTSSVALSAVTSSGVASSGVTSSGVTSASDCAHPRRVLDLEPRYHAWANGERLALFDGARDCDRTGPDDRRLAASGAGALDVTGAPRATPRFLSPVDGDVLVMDPGVPAGQGIPVKIRAPGVSELIVKTDDGHAITLRPPFSAWLDATRGAQSLALYLPGETAPVDVATFTVH